MRNLCLFFVAACHSLGVNARLVHLENRKGNGHYVAEVWSGDHQKWFFMDPLYKHYYCDNNDCWSVLDIHRARLERPILLRSDYAQQHFTDSACFDLFHTLHYFMSNTFFTSPPATFVNLVFGTPDVIHWRDARSPACNKKTGLARLLLFYYLPRVLDPALTPALLVVLAYALVAGIGRVRRAAYQPRP